MSKTSKSSKRRRSGTPGSTGGRPSAQSSEAEPFEVLQSQRAAGNLSGLASVDAEAFNALRGKLLALKVANPYSVGTLKKIKGTKNKYRVRQGDWRALIVADDGKRNLLVEAVLRKNEATYG